MLTKLNTWLLNCGRQTFCRQIFPSNGRSHSLNGNGILDHLYHQQNQNQVMEYPSALKDSVIRPTAQSWDVFTLMALYIMFIQAASFRVLQLLAVSKIKSFNTGEDSKFKFFPLTETSTFK